MSDDQYRQIGEEFLRRAQQVAEPELKLIYVELAAGYDELARFHERVHPVEDPTEQESD
ncbi:MAG TPA: hypothetical protein VGG99_09110 [Acetobacteraceae bacterium]|jgi:hypothetical protein